MSNDNENLWGELPCFSKIYEPYRVLEKQAYLLYEKTGFLTAGIDYKNFDGRFEVFEFAIIDPYTKEKKIPILEMHWSVLGENLFPIRVVNILTGASSFALKEKTYKQKVTTVLRCRGVKKNYL